MEPALITSLAVAVVAAAVSVYSAVSARKSAMHLAATTHTIARIDADSEELRGVYKNFCAIMGMPKEEQTRGVVVAELEMLRACRAVTKRLDEAAANCGFRMQDTVPDWTIFEVAHSEVNELRDAYRESQTLLAEKRAKHLAAKPRTLSSATVNGT
ncbi:hypothetical protein [Arthrobacter sp. SLBN-100]|uniref:hypothetical protein n=1 Tax=Arthrobacter sp. SLBN-100 TaxID=2768450 RepID=UPI001152AAF6|nr:hypothetical protein [Arthrobacter sp. SLBN-100]